VHAQVWFHKISIPPPQGIIGNSEEGVVLIAKILKGMYDDSNKETLCGGSMDFFWNNAF